MADNRFFPWFKLELGVMPAIVPKDASPLEAAKLARAVTDLAGRLSTLLPIDRNFYEADVKVEMRYALTGNTFEITVAGLSAAFYDAIEVGKTSIKIELGYYAGMDEQVLEGVIQKKSRKTGECFYETTLSGVEKGFHLLRTTCLGSEDVFQANASIKDILRRIKERTEVELPAVPATDVLIPREWSFDKKSALDALKQVQDRVRQIEGHGLSVRDGKIWYGENNTGEDIDTPIYNYDNYLVKTKPVSEESGAPRDPCNGSKDDASPGYDFEMLGDPRLRPGDTVRFRVKDDKDEKLEMLTIESITHDFSRTRGYRCTGRALHSKTFLKHVFGAMAPGAGAVGEEVNNMLARNQERSPAVHVGDITSYTPEEHVANARLGLQFEPAVTSPSVQVRLGAEGFTLERRPVTAPFAWNLCGLVVPVYPGMRAVALHNRYLREDALLNGFVWTEEMEPPPSQAGDYWLCLPLDVPSDRPPNNTDKAANDLTTGDGKRVIQLKGLRIEIGEGLLENLGTRPSAGPDDELQIEHSSGAKITMKDNEIKMEAGGRTVTVASGKVSVT